MHAMNNYNHLIYTPLTMWQLLNPFKNERGWNNIFLIAELCFCVPCSNASLERFFSQMRIVKTGWGNSLSESNLTSLLRIKVSGPADKYFAKAINNWYHDKDRRINQKTRKRYRKPKARKTQRKEFQLPYLFETSSESEEEEVKRYDFVKRVFLTCQVKVIHDLINFFITYYFLVLCPFTKIRNNEISSKKLLEI